MTVNKLLIPVLALVIFFGAIGAAQATGNWVVSGRQIYDAGNLSSGSDVRGWMSLQQVADGAGIEITEFYAQLNLPDSIATETALKDLEGVIPAFEVSTVRDLVDIYLGIALPEEEAPVPAAEVVVPAQSTATPAPLPTATPSPVADIEPAATHSPLGDGSGDGTGTGPTPLPPGAVLAAADIKGRSTLQEIVDQADVAADELLAALGLPSDTDMHTALKDLAADGRIGEVDDVRIIVAELQAP